MAKNRLSIKDLLAGEVDRVEIGPYLYLQAYDHERKKRLHFKFLKTSHQQLRNKVQITKKQFYEKKREKYEQEIYR